MRDRVSQTDITVAQRTVQDLDEIRRNDSLLGVVLWNSLNHIQQNQSECLQHRAYSIDVRSANFVKDLSLLSVMNALGDVVVHHHDDV